MGEIIFDILEINIAAAFVIILLCMFAEKLRKRYGAGWMKWAWMLLAVRLLIPYNLSMPFAQIRLFNYAGFEGKAGNDDLSDVSVDIRENRSEMSENQTDHGDLPEGQNGQSAADIQLPRPDYLSETAGAGPAGNEAADIKNEPLNDSTEWNHTDNRSIFSLTIVWLVGVGLSAFYFVISGLLFYCKLKKTLRPVTDTQLIKRLCILQKKYIGQAKIVTYQSKAVCSPLLIGLFRPRLILPADKKEWKPLELELIVAHELCHYRKKDLWLKMLMSVTCFVNWFNPMVYVMKKQFAYDMELACDGSVLQNRDDDERELYARMMLSFAGSRQGASVFSTGFGESRRQMKGRIDYMLDGGAKKRGILSIVMTTVFILVIGMVVSCGYRQEKDGAGDQNLSDSGAKQDEKEQTVEKRNESENSDRNDGVQAENGVQSVFDYNHVYNAILRCDQGNLYLAKEDGIYWLKGGQGEEELLYSNTYGLHRGMEIDGRYLYFSGAVSEGEDDDDRATVWRMDLNTHEVADCLGELGMEFSNFTDVSVYEGNLYVAVRYGRIGFELDERGMAVRQLDDQTQDFLYREYNDYSEAVLRWYNITDVDSAEYQEAVQEWTKQYMAVMDVASCKKLLQGRQVVSRYKNESLHSLYLEDEEGNYEYLCDVFGDFLLITKEGIYYQDILSGEIWYVDYDTKQPVEFYKKEGRDWVENSLITYDGDYVYLLEKRDIGQDEDGNSVAETYMVRVSREGGEAQRVYRFVQKVDMYGDDGWYRHCGVYNGKMYFDNRESFSLNPDDNNMQAVNSGQPCEDAVEMTRVVRDFAEAYFKGDEKELRFSLAEDFEGDVEFYDNPERVDQIEEIYIGGLPDENIDIGVTCLWVNYEFSDHEEGDNVVADLNLSVIKTQAGFKIRSYEISRWER